jgi:PadR family transcriptional regulator PadR
MKTQLRKGVLEMCILATLKQADSYTYELVQLLSTHMAISEGTIYPIMRRLQNDNLVETYLQESQAGPARKYYRLTKMGQHQLKDMLFQWQEFSNEVNSVLSLTLNTQQKDIS